MILQSLALLAAATVVLGKTPTGFTPESNTDLIVTFSSIAALNGVVVSKDVTASQPQIGTTSKLTGTQYAVIMIDLDIPTSNPPQTSTLLHWMQTGLTPATTATTLNTTSGKQQVFLLQNQGNAPAAAPYIQPNPPARIPLSHRYTQILVDTSGIAAASTGSLQTAASNRSGFNAETVLTAAGLQNKVVAGNFFNVTNPGPAQSSGGGTSSNTTSTASGSTPTTNGPKASATFTGAGSMKQPGLAIFSLLVAGAVFGML